MDDMNASAAPAIWQARKSLLPGIENQVATLREYRPLHRFFDLTFFPGLWGMGATLTYGARHFFEPGWMFWGGSILGMVLSAVAINAFTLLLHEGMHATLFANRFLNRWVSVLLGLPVLMSFSAYQVLHLRHHTYLGDPRDPDDYANYSKRPRLVWMMHFVRLLAGAFLYLLCIPVLALRQCQGPVQRRIIEEYLVLVVTVALVAWLVRGEIVLWCWFLPVVLVGYMTNIRGFTQHGITDAADPFLASRTMTPPRLIAFCLLNENYHLEHHLFPEVPSYRLRELHELIWPRLPRAVTGTSYLAFLGKFLRATVTHDETPIGLTAPAGKIDKHDAAA